MFDELGSTQKTFKLKEFTETAKHFLGKPDLDKTIKNLQSIGVEGSNLSDILLKMGFGADEITEKLSYIGTSGVKSTSKLGAAFSGLAAKIGISTTALGVFAVTAIVAVSVIGIATTVTIAYNKIFDKFLKSVHASCLNSSFLRLDYINLYTFIKESIIPQCIFMLVSILSLSNQPNICQFTGANWKTEI